MKEKRMRAQYLKDFFIPGSELGQFLAFNYKL